MNIPYQNLITDANRRKDSLVALEEVLAEVPHMAIMACQLQTFAKKYLKIVKDLDNDSRKLIPSDLQFAMDSALVHMMEHIFDEEYHDQRQGLIKRGLLQLSDYLESQG
jgi:hypothetical protein